MEKKKKKKGVKCGAAPQAAHTLSTPTTSAKKDVKSQLNIANKLSVREKAAKKARVAKPHFKVGQTVRISRIKTKFTRSYDHHWTGELFKVSSLYTHDGAFIYRIKDFHGEEVEGGFYQAELSAASEAADGVYPIEWVLKMRGRGKQQESLVSWFLWPRSHDSWVKRSALKDLPGLVPSKKSAK